LTAPDVNKRFAEMGSTSIGNQPAEFRDFLKSQAPSWRKSSRSLTWATSRCD